MVEMKEEISSDSKKRRMSNESQEENPKKVKHFNAKEFRKQLNSDNKLQALQVFLLSIKNETQKHDCIVDYLQNGGSCIELLQTLEFDSTLSPALVFEIVTYILLKINITFPQYQKSANEACRYLLNNYVTVLNKMINLSSSTPERKSCLKLLTAVVTLSPTLAKDVLMNVNFHSTNVELLTKHTGEKDSVRDHFIRFLTAFLVDGHYPALSMLLEKKGFITSIISGLKFDNADTLCLVINAMKNYILENPSVSKTAKMKTFNTVVVRDIVNLYNWKGPKGFVSQKKNKNTSFTIDEIEKAKVNECVHDFLLILCSSHKYGVIFKDHLLGLGKKNQNPLMYTVLESLERPWDHSYASELVIRICGACPDLAKTMWNILKPSLEPRLTEKWISAVNFAKKLIRVFHPSCMEFCVKELSVFQIFQVVQCLAAPLPIIKAVTLEQKQFDNNMKNIILSLILEMLLSLEVYLDFAKSWLSSENVYKLHSNINNYVLKNFPDPKVVLENWNNTENTDSDTPHDLIKTIFSVFEQYKKLSPSLLYSLSSVELTELLSEIASLCKEDKELLRNIQIKIVSIFIDIDSGKFSTKGDLFPYIIPLLLKFYHEKKDTSSLSVLNKLLKNMDIFEGCEYEINIWINGILDLKSYDHSVAEAIVEIFKNSNDNALQYLKQLSSYSNIVFTTKHKRLSPAILGLAAVLRQHELTKPLKTYLTFVLINLFHQQTDTMIIFNCLNEMEHLPTHLKSYFGSWSDCAEVQSIKKMKGVITTFLQQFSEEFLFGDVDNYLNSIQLDFYADLSLNLVQASVFYVSNMLKSSLLSKAVVENYKKVVEHLIKSNLFCDGFIDCVLSHPVMVQSISFLDILKEKPQGYATETTFYIIKCLINSNYCNIENFLNIYRDKLLNAVIKIFKKPQKYNEMRNQIKEILQTIQLSYKECHAILVSISDLYKTYTEPSDIVVDIITYSLSKFSVICKGNSSLKPLTSHTVKSLSKYITELNKSETDTNHISQAFNEYLETFPHNFEHIDTTLFKSILKRSEVSKGNITLAAEMLQKDDKYIETVKAHLDIVCEKKSVILPLLQVLVMKTIDENILRQIFEKMEPVLMKALQKPQKAGQHFQNHYKGVTALIDSFLDEEKCLAYVQKVQKYETTEVFHVKLLGSIYKKIINENLSEKFVNNIILNLIHLQLNVLKRNFDAAKLNDISSVFNEILEKIKIPCTIKDLQNTCKNESLRLYCKYCLKYGVSGQSVLLKVLRNLIDSLAKHFDVEYPRLLMEMFLSHSEFLDRVLGDISDVKEEILKLFLTFCKNWPGLMERSHLPVLFASYTAMMNSCDRAILTLFKMYESHADATKFYDFKPFLWGRAAASHYSVRQNIENVLWRQPKMSDVLDILQENVVRSTIANYPLNDGLDLKDELPERVDVEQCYDLKFLLPLFSQLLAPEQQVQTYKFTRTGALSLTVVALSSQHEEVRQAACHVLSRFYFHLEARQTGKDNLLWVRYVDAVCKGTASLPDFKLNNFAAMYLSRMALVLTQPTHVMYLPLSQHLTAKSSLDFSTVPELYTFLHSPDVNFREHRRFILELLRDGLRTDKDLTDLLKSMAFKLVSELYSSCVSDIDTKLLILGVMESICKTPLGVKLVNENHSYISYLFCDLENHLNASAKERTENIFVAKILHICLYILKVLPEKTIAFEVFMMLKCVLYSNIFKSLIETSGRTFFEVMHAVFIIYAGLFTDNIVEAILQKCNDPFCKYIFEYGCKFADLNNLDLNDKYYHLRLLIIKLKS